MKRSPEQAYNIRIASRFMALLCLLCAGILEETIDAQYRAEMEPSQRYEDGLKADGDWLTVTDRRDWKVSTRSLPAASSAKVAFDAIIDKQEEPSSPGSVEFEREGKTCRLQAAVHGRRLLFAIRDLTSGKETCAAPGFLCGDGPKDSAVLRDFNAENPLCAFMPYATCPLPPPQNRPPLADTVGELKHEGRMPRSCMLTDPGRSTRKDFLRAMAGSARVPFVLPARRPNGKRSPGEAVESGGTS